MARRGRPRLFDREQALSAAMEIFWDKGYEGASLDDLQAAMGGISPPSFYKAFGSKDALFFEAVELYVKTIGSRPLQALLSASTARAGIEAMLREAVQVYTETAVQRGCLMLTSAINCSPANKGVEEGMRKYRVQAPDIIRKRLERGIAEGDVPKDRDLEPLVSLYASFALGIPMRARDGATKKSLLAGVTAAMAAWDQLIGDVQTARPKRKRS